MANTKVPARLLDTSAIPALNVTGDLTVDTTTLKVDSTNNRVGIGIASPLFPLHINSSITDVAKFQTSGSYTYTRFQNSSKTWALSIGSDFGFYDEAASATRMIIDSSGNVGIGTDNPSAPLHIDAAGMGDIYSGLIQNSTTDTDHYNVVRFIQGASGSATGLIGTGGSATGNTAFRNSFVVGTQSSSPLVFATNDTERMRIDSSGNVDITSGNLFTDTTSGIFFSGGIGSFTNGIYGVGVNNVAIAVGGAQRMIIDSNGTITQNTTSASPVSANFVTGNANCDVTMLSANSASLTRLRNGTNDFQVHTNGVHVFTLDANGGSIHQALDITYKDIGTAGSTTENAPNSHSTKKYFFRITADGAWRKVLGSFHDMFGSFTATISDTASGDVALYTYRITSPAYGVSMFSQTTYTDGGWNTGTFAFRIVADSNTYQLECQYQSYYSSANTGLCYMTINRS